MFVFRKREKRSEVVLPEHLTKEERKKVKHIIEKAKYFGYSGNRVKGLVFCRNINDGKALSEKFTILL